MSGQPEEIRCALCPRPAAEEHHVARRVHDRALTIWLCDSCHRVITAWMYRLRMIRREQPRHTDEREREWALVLGLLLIGLLAQRPDDAPAPRVEVLARWASSVIRPRASCEGLEPRFLPDPVRNDAHGDVPPLRIEDADPDWPVLFRLLAQVGLRLCPDDAQLFQRLERDADRIVTAIRRLNEIETSAQSPHAAAVASALERVLLEHAGNSAAQVPPALTRLASSHTALTHVLELADTRTPGQAGRLLVSLFDQYARVLRQAQTEAA